MSNENIELQKEGGLERHRDELFQSELVQELENIEERLRIAEALNALAEVIKTGGKKSRAEIAETLDTFKESVTSGVFSPKNRIPNRIPREETSED